MAAAFRLDRMRKMVGLLGDPQEAYPVIHITGTNGKGSVARMVTALLKAQGLSVGTYTSPHLQRVNERLAWGGEPIADGDLGEVIAALALVKPFLSSPPTYFELLTAAAYRWFADVAVDVAVVEVGLGGRWDATNVADGVVAVVTNVSLDHTEVIGPRRLDIAWEKAGIVKAGATLVLGETDAALAGAFADTAAASVLTRGTDFGWTSNSLAHGGRLVELFTSEG
ncbi:MAG: bifunctional folylpolyglutamate synthase/dihydrofolate synthase, partial [Pseudonocardiaceae bacterium]